MMRLASSLGRRISTVDEVQLSKRSLKGLC
jgi:hypothetical protein